MKLREYEPYIADILDRLDNQPEYLHLSYEVGTHILNYPKGFDHIWDNNRDKEDL